MGCRDKGDDPGEDVGWNRQDPDDVGPDADDVGDADPGGGGEDEGSIPDAIEPGGDEGDATDSGGDDEEVEPLELDDFLESVWAARCEQATRCQISLGGMSEESCLALFDAGAMRELSDVVRSVEEGVASYDPIEGASCVGQLQELACQKAVEGAYELCRPAFTGLTQIGESCISSWACEPGFCVNATDFECGATCSECEQHSDCADDERCTQVGGTFECMGPGEAGHECEDDRHCAPGFFCEDDGYSSFCQALPGEGEACIDRCASDDLRCISDAQNVWTCQILPEAGEPCFNGMCDDDSYCNDMTEPAVCSERSGADERCNPNGESCQAEFFCGHTDDGWTCIKLGEEGAECQHVDECEGYLICDEGDQKCVMPDGAEGEDCSLTRYCDDDLECRWDNERRSNYCTKTGGEGEDCRIDRSCDQGLSCIWSASEGEDLCLPTGGEGEPCTHGWGCDEGLTCAYEADDDEWSCHPAGGEGQLCDSGWNCDDELVCEWDDDTEVARCFKAGGDGERCREGGTCDAGLWCSYEPGSRSRCLPLATKDEPCDVGRGSCAEGLTCVPDLEEWDMEQSEAPPMSCLPEKGEGDECSTIFECGGIFSSLYCDDDEESDTYQRCITRHGPGQACVILIRPQIDEDTGEVVGVSSCDPMTSYCDFDEDNPTCQPLRRIGDSCENDRECMGEFALRPVSCELDICGGPVCPIGTGG